MTAVRSYKRPMSVATARRELASVAGTQLDPACVRAFLGASLPRVLWAVGPLALLINLPVLRGVAEAGRIVEHASVAAAGQAATVAVAATTAAVLAVPGVAPAVTAGSHVPRMTHGHTSEAGASKSVVSPVQTTKTEAPTGSQVHDAVLRTGPSTHTVPSQTRHSKSAAARQRARTVQPKAATEVPSVAPVVAAAVNRPVSLGSAANFAILAGSTITNTGPTSITGNVGLSPGTAVTGFLGGLLDVTVHADNGVASQAKSDLAGAYDDAVGRPTTSTIPVELGGTTQTPGVYESPAGTFGITGTVTLDAKGDPGAVFIFKSASTLITASGSRVKLINGAQAANVFWQVGSSATLGTYSVLRGNVMALASITVTTGTTVEGRMLARTGAVTLDSDTITRTPGGR
jgi:hypothetical protein